jgi:hypothetical protein
MPNLVVDGESGAHHSVVLFCRLLVLCVVDRLIFKMRPHFLLSTACHNRLLGSRTGYCVDVAMRSQRAISTFEIWTSLRIK